MSRTKEIKHLPSYILISLAKAKEQVLSFQRNAASNARAVFEFGEGNEYYQELLRREKAVTNVIKR